MNIFRKMGMYLDAYLKGVIIEGTIEHKTRRGNEVYFCLQDDDGERYLFGESILNGDDTLLVTMKEGDHVRVRVENGLFSRPFNFSLEAQQVEGFMHVRTLRCEELEKRLS